MILNAKMSKAEACEFNKKAKKRETRLLNSKEKYCPGFRKWVLELTWDSKQLDIQSHYENVRYGDSTVADSASEILVCKFLELVLTQKDLEDKEYSVKELAELAEEFGYQDETGRSVFFDRFVSSVYGFDVERAASINSILESLVDGGLPVLELQLESELRYTVLCGFDEQENTVLLYHPDYPKQMKFNLKQVLKRISNAWIVFD